VEEREKIRDMPGQFSIFFIHFSPSQSLLFPPVTLLQCTKCLQQKYKTPASLANHRKFCNGISPLVPRISRREEQHVADDDHVGGSRDWASDLPPSSPPPLNLDRTDTEEQRNCDLNDSLNGSVIYVDSYSRDFDDSMDFEDANAGDDDEEPNSDAEAEAEAANHLLGSDQGSDSEEEDLDMEVDHQPEAGATTFSLDENLPVDICEFLDFIFLLALTPPHPRINCLFLFLFLFLFFSFFSSFFSSILSLSISFDHAREHAHPNGN